MGILTTVSIKIQFAKKYIKWTRRILCICRL